MYAVNVGLPKTVVRLVTSWLAESGRYDPAISALLRDILDTPISPELLPTDQKTEDTIGPYALHDFFLYYVLRHGFAPAKIVTLAEEAFAGTYDRAAIIHWLSLFYRRFFTQQFKRSCMPDGPAVGPISLSPRGGWRMPSDVAGTAWQKELDLLK